MRAIVLADGPGPLVELCGISLLERLLRTLQRSGYSDAVVVTSTPELYSPRLSRPAPARRGLTVTIHHSPPGPLRGWNLVTHGVVPDRPGERCLLVPADSVFDGRLLRALLDAPAPTALVDSAPPGNLDPLHLTVPRVDGRLLSGAIVADVEWLRHAGSIEQAIQDGLDQGRIGTLDVASVNPHVVSMRRQIRPFWFPAPAPAARPLATAVLLDSAQKGTLDFPARMHAPIETAVVRRLCHTPVTPNQLTLINTLVAWSATGLFLTGRLGWGLLVALLVGILDGLDGKLARVRVETSDVGRLEHLLDYCYEVSWWGALAFHFQRVGSLPSAWALAGLLVGSDLVDKLAHRRVKQLTGRDLDDQTPFDALIRLVGGRRNVYVWLLAVGLVVGHPAPAYVTICWWGAATAAVHAFRVTAISAQRRSQA
jgi:phosphatidylglycerophosphate synthase